MSASLTFDDERASSRVLLDRELVLVGSGARADVVIEDAHLSPLHCAIIHTRDGWKVIDLYSRQGTRVNDQSVADHVLQSGDRISLGKVSATFETTEDDPPAVAGEVQLEDGRGDCWRLESDWALIGSWAGCDIVVDRAEPAHAIVVHFDRGALVRATGEAGLVIVNGRRTEGCALWEGDILQVGKGRFTVLAPHLPRRSDREPADGVSASNEEPAVAAIIEEQKRLLQLLDLVGQVPKEIRQLREEIGRQLPFLIQEMRSTAQAVEEQEKHRGARATEHASKIELLGRDLSEHGELVKKLTDRLGRVVDAVESTRDATESAVRRFQEERTWLSTELDSRDKALQKVWEGLVQVRKAVATPLPDSTAVEAVDELRRQVAGLGTQLAELRSQLPRQLTNAIKGLRTAGRPVLAELAERRAALADRERRLAEERKKLEETRREIVSKGEETLRAVAAAEQRQDQREVDLDKKERLLAQREEQSLSLAKSMAGKIERPGRIIASAGKSASANQLLGMPPWEDNSESPAPSPSGSDASTSDGRT